MGIAFIPFRKFADKKFEDLEKKVFDTLHKQVFFPQRNRVKLLQKFQKCECGGFVSRCFSTFHSWFPADSPD